MYKLLKQINSDTPTHVVNVVNGYVIPFDEANTDYQTYLTWVAEGNTPEEWSPNGDQ
jgi:hypothetical protein